MKIWNRYGDELNCAVCIWIMIDPYDGKHFYDLTDFPGLGKQLKDYLIEM